MALHQRLMVEVRYACIFHVATHIKYLIGDQVVKEFTRIYCLRFEQDKELPCTSQEDLGEGTQMGSGS